jgi:serine/threonine protein kinase
VETLSLSAQPLLPPGLKVGRYELIRSLAIGGMAELYEAAAHGIEGFEKRVVLKRIRKTFARSGEHIRMFLDEARLAAMMHHPNIVEVFDIGRLGTSGDYFYAMELVDGTDLLGLMKAARTGDGRLPIAHAIGIVIAAAAGLHHAHELVGPTGLPLGVVHRDVSPQNILVSREGWVKITDFGIARGEHRSHLTRAGWVKGKVAYMSPEQKRGEGIDRRSDIFSLGVVLHELTTGERSTASPRTIDRRYPPRLERIVMKALSPDRDARYATARDLQVELSEFARDEGLESSPLAFSDFVASALSFADSTDALETQARSTETPLLTIAAHVISAPPSQGRRTAVLAAGALIGALWVVARLGADEGREPPQPQQERAMKVVEPKTAVPAEIERAIPIESAMRPPRHPRRMRRAPAHIVAPPSAARKDEGGRAPRAQSWDPDSPFADVDLSPEPGEHRCDDPISTP